ncbi:MAG: preprotein translocase subunit YajC [Coriobacteriaceae bacterium]|nr:preprotein translocase subunit YajC [Coriobacteriaceae bacterium]
MDEQQESIGATQDVSIASKFIKKRPVAIVNMTAITLALILCIASGLLCVELSDANADLERANAQFTKLDEAANSFLAASDYLTSESRMYVATGNVNYLANYITEYEETKSRDAAVATLKNESGNVEAAMQLDDALNRSNRLAEDEFYAMRLKADSVGGRKYPAAIESVTLSAEDAALSPEGKDAIAHDIMFGENYNELKSGIIADVEQCSGELSMDLKGQIEALDHRSATLLAMTIAVSIALALLVILVAFVNYYLLVIRPQKKQAWEDYVS